MILSNDAPNTFLFTIIWRWTYGNEPFSQREETRCRHMNNSFRLADRIVYTTTFVTPVGRAFA